VPVASLLEALHATGRPLPRLFYLSSCHGLTAGGAAANAPATREGERFADPAALGSQPSTAAALHRGGFAQVVGYFGPVGDDQATRLAADFYAALAGGAKARDALRQARELAKKPLRVGDGYGVYPLGWAQLALYHRGPDLPTAQPSAAGKAPLAPPLQRVFERLDKTGGIPRVEQRHDVPLVGVQQLRFGFIGRRAARAEGLKRWRQGQRVLVVVGLGGLGKTALCTEWVRLFRARTCLALDGRFAGAQADPIAALWREVAAARQDEAWTARLAQWQKGGLTAEALLEAIGALAERIAAEAPAGSGEKALLVYLDDAESLQEEVGAAPGLGRWRSEALRTFWQGLVARAHADPRLALLASSRYRPEGTPEAAVVSLSPMSPWEMVRLMTWMPTLRGVPHRDREWLAAERLEGHPRTVEWLEVLAQVEARKKAPEVAEFTGDWRRQVLEPALKDAGERVAADLLLERVWQALDHEAREHLGRCSVLTQAAPWGAVLALEPEGVEGRSARTLRDAGLLSPFFSPEKHPWWGPHRGWSARWPGSSGKATRRQRIGWWGGGFGSGRWIRRTRCVFRTPSVRQSTCATGETGTRPGRWRSTWRRPCATTGASGRRWAGSSELSQPEPPGRSRAWR
jgi:hypothetical protein